MSTVVFKGGTIAGDTLGTNGGITNQGFGKIAKTKQYLIGITGLFSVAPALYELVSDLEDSSMKPVEFYRKHRQDYDTQDLDFNCFFADESGVIYHFGDQAMLTRMPMTYFASGSGESFALGALSMGATAEQAVKVACDHDVYSGGVIETLTFKSPKTHFRINGVDSR